MEEKLDETLMMAALLQDMKSSKKGATPLATPLATQLATQLAPPVPSCSTTCTSRGDRAAASSPLRRRCPLAKGRDVKIRES
ncbi:hypothetical protein EYF80_040391 [Liparis tanakae]|uniref:Uncharacterized protein n=1 Tax=Liparis tanakae TaxID=230148 RepID=A0A4Z2G7A4_9TELE|nr:hypothetical protein EYF80_040391 [Liparis tanakae]